MDIIIIIKGHATKGVTESKITDIIKKHIDALAEEPEICIHNVIAKIETKIDENYKHN